MIRRDDVLAKRETSGYRSYSPILIPLIWRQCDPPVATKSWGFAYSEWLYEPSTRRSEEESSLKKKLQTRLHSFLLEMPLNAIGVFILSVHLNHCPLLVQSMENTC